MGFCSDRSGLFDRFDRSDSMDAADGIVNPRSGKPLELENREPRNPPEQGTPDSWNHLSFVETVGDHSR
jgi:hypothetical protein